MPISGNTLDSDDTQAPERVTTEGAGMDSKNPLLVAVGERVRQLRARRGMTRKATAHAAQVSERHLANLEYGLGNASLLVLHQVALALQCSLAELMGDVTTSSPEWLMLRELLEGRDEDTLRRVRVTVGQMLGTGGSSLPRLRLAPASTLPLAVTSSASSAPACSRNRFSTPRRCPSDMSESSSAMPRISILTPPLAAQ